MPRLFPRDEVAVTRRKCTQPLPPLAGRRRRPCRLPDSESQGGGTAAKCPRKFRALPLRRWMRTPMIWRQGLGDQSLHITVKNFIKLEIIFLQH